MKRQYGLQSGAGRLGQTHAATTELANIFNEKE